MLSRRGFLRLGAAGVAAAGTRTAAQQGTPGPGAGLPPSIAALRSRRDRAVPISLEERQARIDRARELMAAQRIDAVVLAGGTSLAYFTGVRWGNSERLFAALLPARGEPIAICPAFERDRAHEQLARGPLASADVRTWQEDESPFALVARGLEDRGIASGRIGVEETIKFVFSDGMAAAAPSARFVSATPITAGCRMIKSAQEVALMRLASEVTLAVYEAVYHALADGMTQHEVGSLIAAAYERMGFPGYASVQVGEYTALPHGSTTPQVIREGTIVMLDDGCSVEGYQSDLTRTFVLGRPTDKMKRVFDVVRRAQTAALRAARPGVPLDAIDAAARQVIVKAGYGPGFAYFTHRLGHGLGMDGHEWPYLVRNNMFGWERALRLAPHMTFSDEPGIYIRGEFGVRLEDDMHVTAEGAELLTPQSPSIEQPFGA